MRRSLLPLTLAALLPFAAMACGSADQKTADSVISDTDSIIEETVGSMPTEEETRQQVENMKKGMEEYAQRLKGDVKSTAQDAREAAIAGLVGNAAPGEFERRGVTLDGTPSCEAKSASLDTYHVECDGVSTDGKPVKLVGDDTGDGKATFVGTVDGKEVFKQGCIAVC